MVWDKLQTLFRQIDALRGEEEPFSFIRNAAGPQSSEKTLMILTYELGRLIEYSLKADIYGEKDLGAYFSEENQQKEMSDIISMSRYYCELRSWDYEALKKWGEQGYLDRMKDIQEHGVKKDE